MESFIRNFDLEKFKGIQKSFLFSCRNICLYDIGHLSNSQLINPTSFLFIDHLVFLSSSCHRRVRSAEGRYHYYTHAREYRSKIGFQITSLLESRLHFVSISLIWKAWNLTQSWGVSERNLLKVNVIYWNSSFSPTLPI
jgi:hypothetical protein